jgi:hypothetical protein
MEPFVKTDTTRYRLPWKLPKETSHDDGFLYEQDRQFRGLKRLISTRSRFRPANILRYRQSNFLLQHQTEMAQHQNLTDTLPGTNLHNGPHYNACASMHGPVFLPSSSDERAIREQVMTEKSTENSQLSIPQHTDHSQDPPTPIICRVVDDRNGLPAVGMHVSLRSAGSRFYGTTDSDGRVLIWKNCQGRGQVESDFVKGCGGVKKAILLWTELFGSQVWDMIFHRWSYFHGPYAEESMRSRKGIRPFELLLEVHDGEHADVQVRIAPGKSLSRCSQNLVVKEMQGSKGMDS